MQKIHGFDALRAVSVVLVILSHIGITAAADSDAWRVFFSVFNADYGVKTFFVLSGFLITSLLIREYNNTGRISVPAFMMRRALRILPLYFLILGIIVMLVWMGLAEDKVTARIYGTLFIYNFIPRVDSVNYMNHMWSLAVEEQFYILWPIIFALIFPRGWSLPVFATAIIGVCYWRMVAGYGTAVESYSPLRWTIPAVHPIMVGCLAAWIVDKFPTSARGWQILLASGAIISLPLWTAMTPAVVVAGSFGIAGIIAWIYCNQDNRAVRMLDWGPVGYIGMISYGLYMWQGLLTGNGPYRVPGFREFPLDPYLGAALTIPAAILSFHLFERPISAIRSKFRPKSGVQV